MNIVKLPAKTLREPSDEVLLAHLKKPEIQRFIDELIPTMYRAEGIGIASSQVGKNIRICVVGKEAIPEGHALFGTDLVLVNPELERLTKKSTVENEGCLSVPGTFGPVKRHRDLHVTALNRHGEPLAFDAHGFFARVIQHEFDHLEGILFVDRAKSVQSA